MDTKNKPAQQQHHSASSLPIFSPAVPKDSMKHISFTNAIMNLGQLDHSQAFLEEQTGQKDDESPKLLSGKWKSEKPEYENDFRLMEYKNQQKIISQIPSYDSLPVKTKCKIISNEQVLDVPQLTAESMVQSQQFDVDNESNSNDLPISSISRYKIERVFNEQSEGSDDIPENQSKRKFYHPKEDYAESKCSQQSQSDDILTICRNCFCIIQKSKIIEGENGELLKQVKFLQDELIKQQQKYKAQIQQIKEDSEAKKADLTLPPLQMKQYFLSQVEELNRSLTKVNELIKSYAIDFRGNETHVLEKLITGVKIIQKEVLCLQKKQERRCQVQQIHNNYKKLISKLIKDVEQREVKKDQQFKRFIQAVTDKRIQSSKQSQQSIKSLRNRRKSKTYTQKDQIYDDQIIQQQKIQQQKKQRVQWLQLNYEKQKQKFRQFEKCQKELARKYSQQFSDLLKEKAAYQNLLQKYTDQFAFFMKKVAKDQTSANIESQFFKNLSQRIFQISNSIPFQENDEQNLFAPENSEELFDMIERIRRFYLKIQKYNKNREQYYQSEKSSFLLLFKDLVQYRKIDDCFILQVLEHKKYSRLSDLKELIHSTRQKRKQLIETNSRRQQKNGLKMQRTHSFTINELENTDDY